MMMMIIVTLSQYITMCRLWKHVINDNDDDDDVSMKSEKRNILDQKPQKNVLGKKQHNHGCIKQC